MKRKIFTRPPMNIEYQSGEVAAFMSHLSFNLRERMVEVTLEKGLSVQRIRITIREAEEIGLINPQALIPYSDRL